jgi:hypothetical protein
MAIYELILLGVRDAGRDEQLLGAMKVALADYQLALGEEFLVLESGQLSQSEGKATRLALYFGGAPDRDVAQVDHLEDQKVPVIPVLASEADVQLSIPETLRSVNAQFLDGDNGIDSLVATILEGLGLLRQQRRIFVSYRRTESRDVAVQLHDELSARGFDVFLDTHDIRPGDPFQEMLWHRLADCDVVIMLDTPGYFDSKWTVQELGRTLSKGILVLRIVWPTHLPTRLLDLSETVQLQTADMHEDRLVPEMITEVARRTERLRSRSVATRHLDLAGRMCLEIERIGGKVEGIGAFRAIAATLPNGLELQAYPAVGVPTAELLHDIEERARKMARGRFPCVVYDERGIRPAWIEHLKWLDAKIRDVRALKIYDAAWELAEWDS